MITMFPLCFFTVIRWFIILKAMHQSSQLFLSPTHPYGGIGIAAGGGMVYYYCVFIYSSCASPFTFLKALEVPEESQAPAMALSAPLATESLTLST